MPFTTEVIPRNAAHQGELRVADELGVSFLEPERLTQLTQPLDVYRSRTHEGERFDVVPSHNPIDGRQLLGFLKEIAPNKIGVSPEGVVGDWNVTDRAQDPDARNARELVDLHRFLGGPWLEFVKSQPAFLAMMEDARAPRFEPRFLGLYDPTLSRGESLRQGALSEIVKVGATSVDRMLDMLEKDGQGVDREIVLEAIKAEVNKKRKAPQKPIKRAETLQRRFQSWHPSRRDSFIRNIIRSELDEEQLELLLQATVDELYDTIVLPDGQKYGFARSLLDKPLEATYADRTTVVDGGYQGQFIKLPGKKGELVDVVVPGSVQRVTDGPQILPRISWLRTKDGKREFIIERGTHIDGGFRFSDGVLGVLAVAYFSPEVRKEWPEQMRIRGSRDQFMGPAQVPVLALMRSTQLLKTDFVEAAESVAV